MRARIPAVAAIVGALVAGAVAGPASAAAQAGRTTTPIQHFVYLMQGDRSFDNYFGTYPGADGIPRYDCQALVLGRPQSGCVLPFALHGEPPKALAAGKSILQTQYDNGKMDGFVAAYEKQGRDGTSAMGYYDRSDLPFYWGVADKYVLFDRFFSSARYGNRTNRSYWVAAAPPPGGTERIPKGGYGGQLTIFDRLTAAGISWKFYVQDYDPRETFRAVSTSDPAAQTVRVPLLNYARFVDDPALRRHIVDLDQYYRDLVRGTLPAVAYVASSGASERSARSIPAGQKLVRNLVTQLQLSRYWSSSALMWSYDGSGGWYDHVRPPQVDGEGYGLRVPALLAGAYARPGQVNHETLDYTAALKFIEQNWRLRPLTSRDASAGSLMTAFDFAAKPRPAALISVGGGEPHAALVKVALTYWLYGAAALIALLLLAAPTVASLVRARRRRAAPPAPSEPRTAVPVP